MIQMKRSWTRYFFALILLMNAGWAQNGAIEKAVAAREQQWLQSQKTNNPELLVPLLAENFSSTLSDGKVTDKAGMLATSKSTKWNSVEYSDVKVRVFGDAAVATGGYKANGTDGTGKAFSANERWTDTWVKMSNGEWQCVASQDTPVQQ
jgi:hypothetical protein